MEKSTDPMSYDHFKKLDANDIIEAKRAIRQHVKEKESEIERL